MFLRLNIFKYRLTVQTTSDGGGNTMKLFDTLRQPKKCFMMFVHARRLWLCV